MPYGGAMPCWDSEPHCGAVPYRVSVRWCGSVPSCGAHSRHPPVHYCGSEPGAALRNGLGCCPASRKTLTCG
jgi:hypothetical protein